MFSDPGLLCVQAGGWRLLHTGRSGKVLQGFQKVGSHCIDITVPMASLSMKSTTNPLSSWIKEKDTSTDFNKHQVVKQKILSGLQKKNCLFVCHMATCWNIPKNHRALCIMSHFKLHTCMIISSHCIFGA